MLRGDNQQENQYCETAGKRKKALKISINLETPEKDGCNVIIIKDTEASFIATDNHLGTKSGEDSIAFIFRILGLPRLEELKNPRLNQHPQHVEILRSH